MSFPLVFHPDVKPEIDEAYRWYEEQKTGLGDDFLSAVEEVFDRIAETPKMHGKAHKDVRRALPKRFPYCVYYRLHADRVEVVAVYHGRRDPGGRQSRV